MRTRTRTTIAALCSATLLGFAAEGRAQVRHETHDAPLQELLELSAEQRSAIAQQKARVSSACAPLVEKVDALRGEQEQAAAAGDTSRLGVLLLAEWEANAAIRKQAVAHRERVLAILTPAQAEQLELVRAIAGLAIQDPRFLEHAGFVFEGDRLRHSRRHDGSEATSWQAKHADPGAASLRHQR